MRGAFLAVMRSEPHQAAAATGGLELVTTFTRSERLYLRLLRHPAFMRVFSRLRDRHRVEGLREIATARIEVYRIR
jgi:hypothetical protein